MTCEHCCGANDLFSFKDAQKQMRRYKEKGAAKSTQKLIDLLPQDIINKSSLLDIGGGIGAIQWHFLTKNAHSTTDIDASDGYLSVAKQYAQENDWGDKTTYLKGDFLDVHTNLGKYDFVTLDKVICCYPHFMDLLNAALSRSNNVIALSFPLGGPVSMLLSKIAAIYMSLKKNPFRSFVHPPKRIHETIVAAGFELDKAIISFPWHIRTYRKLQVTDL